MDERLDPTPTTRPRPGQETHRVDAAGRDAAAQRQRQRYGSLLGALVATFALQGIATPGPAEQVVVSVLLATTLLLSLWAAEAKPRVFRPAIVVAAVLVAAGVLEAAAGNVDATAARIADLLLVSLAPPAVIVGVVRSLRARGGVTIEAVFGVLCLYLLLGMGFALVYSVINNVGGPFFAEGVSATTARCLYFSFATLTTVGYGDLTAESNLGHTLSVAEALVGQIYLVTIVSVIVSNLRPRARAQ